MTPGIAFAWMIVLLTALAAPALRRRATWIRLLASLVSMALLTDVVIGLVGSPFQPKYAPGLTPFAAFSEKVFVAGWWLLIARIVIYAGKIALGINHQRHTARLLADLTTGAIYLSALFAIVDFVFGISVPGLVATSGVIAIVLGLALQSTLSDLFSGIALGIDRPFGVGDLVVIEGAVEGRVIETNWRSTRISTGSNDIATVPNSIVAKTRITNRSVPSEVHTDTIKVMVDPAVRPKLVIAMLRASVLTTASIPASEHTSVVCTDLLGEGGVYEVQFGVPLKTVRETRSDLLDEIVRHARYNGMALAPQNGLPLTPVEPPKAIDVLGEISILDALSEEQRQALAATIICREGKVGEALTIQGGSAASLFAIVRGAFSVTRDWSHGPRRVGIIGPGDYFGEMALLTGSPNAASVTALTPFVSYELTKDMMVPLLTGNVDLLRGVERAAAQAQATLDRTVAAQVSAEPETAIRILDRIRAFFDEAGGHGTRDSAEA